MSGLWGSILFTISSIFDVKKFKNSSAVNEELDGGVFLVSLLKVSWIVSISIY